MNKKYARSSDIRFIENETQIADTPIDNLANLARKSKGGAKGNIT